MPITANLNGSWSERNIAAIADCMDVAFANVLSAEFDRLAAGMTPDQRNARLTRSECSILRLRNSSDMPDYSDPMVVIRYVILYQLPHINLAYTLLKGGRRHGQGLTSTGALQVVDFGAGTLAMSFGVALAVADALANGDHIRAVRIDAIDTNGPMLELGLKIWNEFVSVVSRRNGVERLAQSARLIQQIQHDSHRSVQKQDGHDCWLTALHVLYNNNQDSVRLALASLCDKLNPSLMVLTCYTGKSEIASRVLPTGYDWQRDRVSQLCFRGYIDNSRAANAAFSRRFQPSSWHARNLYTDVLYPETFICREHVCRPARTPKQPSPESERLRERQRQAEEVRRREAQEREQQQQYEARRQREMQEQEQEREQQQRRQEEARRHSDRISRPAMTSKQPSPEAERLRERQQREE